MHDGVSSAEGRGRVDRGSSPLACAGALMSFPPAGKDLPVRVTFEQAPGGEVWRRTFGRHSFQSHQYDGRGKSERLIIERFGALEFAMALVVEGDRLRLVTRRWSAFGMPLPIWLAPRSNAYESEENGAFRFFVEISHALTGLIVRYDGWLKPQPPGGRAE
ncbi:MAG: DUF4166 domain-containing protein [Caulobacteraceae bacterium]|nr:DUF4166 domain-containing protein [Caulobacteraceae bacterium]